MASLQEGLRAHTVWLSQLLIPSPYSSLEPPLPTVVIQ